jgi:hypothetical protein
VLTYRNGAPVMLTDVAKVVDGIENGELSAWMNKTPAVIVNIQRQPGANIIDVVDKIKALLPKLRATIPPIIKISVLDRPDHDGSGLGLRRGIRAAAVHRARGRRDLRLSCAPWRRPSFRASRCRCRWSARSPPCTRSVSA